MVKSVIIWIIFHKEEIIMEKHSSHNNGTFSSAMGFVIACVGSAVGLGNIWMFPYRLGQYGGAAFLIPYLLFIFLFGWVGLSAEFAIGRRAGTGTLGSYHYCYSRGASSESSRKNLGSILGWIPLFGSLGIAIGYAIILGWVLRFFGGSVTGSLMSADTQEVFSAITGSFGSLTWHIIVVAIVTLVLCTGVTDRIEGISKVLMPLFFILFLLLAIYVCFLPGAASGYAFLFVPDWSKLLDVNTWVMAMGQAFFSLSITGSGMIVYGAYLGKNVDIPGVSLKTAGFDTIAALLSSLVIMPAVFAFGIDPKSGPPLLFLTLPKVFAQMPLGQVFSIIFFLSVFFAGITSLINMFEAVIESTQHKLRLNRKAAVLLCGVLTLLVGVFLEPEARVGNWMDFITIIIVPFGAVLGAISIYYVFGYQNIHPELELGRKKPVSPWFGITAKCVYVPLTIIVFVLGLIYHGIG